MYKHQPQVVRSLRESWQEIEVETESTSHQFKKPLAARRASDPITIFSVGDTDLEAPHRGILPSHVAGVFVGQGYDDSSCHPDTLITPDRAGKQSEESLTSLGSALDEVIESVDQTTEHHQRSRSNSRIQDWLGQQSQLLGERKRKCSVEERKRLKGITERIMRELLGIDKSVLDILFRPKPNPSQTGARLAKELEMKIWKRWIELTERDTASLTSAFSTSAAVPVPPTVPLAHASGQTRSGLEKIPWGVPEDAKDDAYWDEELSIPMIFRYIKSYMTRNSRYAQSANVTGHGNDIDRDEHIDKHLKATQPEPTTVQSTVTGPSTMHTFSTIGPRQTLSRQTLSKSGRLHGLSPRDRSRSRTSRSSSYQALSLRTGTCSVASVRRSALGSNFWDLGSMGGASINSRDVGGHWSVYA